MLIISAVKTTRLQVNYNFWTSGNFAAQSWVSECPDVKNYKWQLNPVWHMMRWTDSLWQQWALKGLNYWQWVMVYCLYPRHEQKTWADRSFQTSSQTSPQVPSIACTSTRPRPGTATSNGRIRWRRTWHVPTPHSIHQSCLGIKTRFCGIGHRRLALARNSRFKSCWTFKFSRLKWIIFQHPRSSTEEGQNEHQLVLPLLSEFFLGVVCSSKLHRAPMNDSLLKAMIFLNVMYHCKVVNLIW